MRRKHLTFSKTPMAIALALASLTTSSVQAANAAGEAEVEEIVVWGQASVHRAASSHPSSMLTQQDLVSINVATTEDVVKFEPSLVIRRRFIGDSNGTMGMRGSNMFQTSRSMVFADGVPLHYLLQSRWNGAPRWTMVSASEIAQVEVLYGPFSAEFSGNSMGGVVLIESAIPQEREFHFDSSFFSQSFDAYGFDDTVNGHKSFFSYGDRFANRYGDTSVYLSYNRLDSESQPQTFYYGANSSATNAAAVSGGVIGNDEFSTSRLWFGDTGVQETITDNYKIKIGHDFGNWETLLNVAYEDRFNGSNSPNSYMRNASGASVWSGNVVQDGRRINIPAARLGVSELQRDSLSVGLRIRGEVSEGVIFEANLNEFQVLNDENRSSLSNPSDPAYTLNGQVTRFGDTGWRSAEAKLSFDNMSVEGMGLIIGARHDAYELNMDVFNSTNYVAGTFNGFTSRSGGETSMDALFAQMNYDINAKWDMGLGVRWEAFESDNGYFSRDVAATPQFDLVAVPKSSDRKVSPKFSLGYQPVDNWRFAYALGKAYRFPIVEELFSQYSAYNAISVANPELKPEDGIHQNFMMERQIANGVLRVNLFQETVKDVVESQSETLPGGLTVRTFIPVDEIETRGVEFIANVDDVLVDNLEMRFNMVFTDSEIVKNAADRSIEGNVYPRMPEWRGNLLLTYHLRSNWDAGINLQYASDSFGRNDNRDRQDGVYGAQDSYTRLGFKSTYNFSNGVALGFGVDNVTNEISYVAHPWPGRTYYANVSYDF
ncbi:MAG: TonB-dependent receptor [Gammaproteobacteria bacterium]|nr:TonB-dependent receptor [Gammaproteobacteria bacterium]MDP2346916.1 TonB-dependent receptor [Gammaproteobacteria bacterium]